MGINKEWHLRNKMPENATPGQRLRWHVEHEKHCACRKMTEKMRVEMKKRGNPMTV